MKILKTGVVLVLLTTSPLAFAHCCSDGTWAQIIVLLSIVPILVQATLVLLLRWAKLFEHRWLVTLSFIASSMNTLIWLVSLLGFANGVPDLFNNEKLMTLGLFVVVIINLAVIIWMFKSPSKQFQQ